MNVRHIVVYRLSDINATVESQKGAITFCLIPFDSTISFCFLRCFVCDNCLLRDCHFQVHNLAVTHLICHHIMYILN